MEAGRDVIHAIDHFCQGISSGVGTDLCELVALDQDICSNNFGIVIRPRG
jgi:hypothetical protein